MEDLCETLMISAEEVSRYSEEITQIFKGETIESRDSVVSSLIGYYSLLAGNQKRAIEFYELSFLQGNDKACFFLADIHGDFEFYDIYEWITDKIRGDYSREHNLAKFYSGFLRNHDRGLQLVMSITNSEDLSETIAEIYHVKGDAKNAIHWYYIFLEKELQKTSFDPSLCETILGFSDLLKEENRDEELKIFWRNIFLNRKIDCDRLSEKFLFRFINW